MSIRNLIPWHRPNRTYVPVASSLESPRDTLQALHNEVDRMFDEVFHWNGPGSRWLEGSPEIWPRIDVADDEKEVRVVADLPGMDQGDIDLSIDNGILTIKGEKRSEVEDKDAGVSERFFGRFERQIPIGSELKEDAIDAHFDNGVLKIVLPKMENAVTQTKRISIRT